MSQDTNFAEQERARHPTNLQKLGGADVYVAFVESYGGCVKLLSLLSGYSTTALVSRIIDSETRTPTP